MQKKKYPNLLYVARLERGLSQRDVAAIIRLRGTQALSKYERGIAMPPVRIAMRLEILYRIPFAFHYPNMYVAERLMIREAEERHNRRIKRRRAFMRQQKGCEI